MRRRSGALLVLVLVLATLLATPALAQTPSRSPSPSASVSPSPAAGSDGLSPAAIVIGLLLIGGLYFARTRMGRDAGGR